MDSGPVPSDLASITGPVLVSSISSPQVLDHEFFPEIIDSPLDKYNGTKDGKDESFHS